MQLINADCIAAMRQMPDNSVDSIVTDPPYELGFMGKSWDSTGIANSVEMWRQALRVLKPGGHLLAFSGSRTYHRMVVAVEDAGFEIRDQIMWVYGSGFPKSHNISKGIDKAAGAEREVVGKNSASFGYQKDLERWDKGSLITIPATPAAKQWDGWGTALKPAHEPIVLARKPFIGTVANNVLTYGTGGLNIDGCRVGTGTGEVKSVNYPDIRGNNYNNASGSVEYQVTDQGRWPANFMHDGSDEVVELLGDAARFFYSAKASKDDRNEGLDEFEEINYHPTVKPTDLMRYLVRMVTPPGGIVLDPFMGSGSTGKACMYEGFEFIGIDKSADYVTIAKTRINEVLLELAATLFPNWRE